MLWPFRYLLVASPGDFELLRCTSASRMEHWDRLPEMDSSPQAWPIGAEWPRRESVEVPVQTICHVTRKKCSAKKKIGGVLRKAGSPPNNLGRGFPLAHGRVDLRNRQGFAGPLGQWQFSTDMEPGEIFADMFVGWVYGRWARGPRGQALAGKLKADFMSENMAHWIDLAIVSTAGSIE